MCGRYVNAAKKEQIKKEFQITKRSSVSDKPRYNIAPTQMIDVILNDDSETVLTELKWGLVPHWAKDSKIGSKLINARAETLAEKPSFRDAFKSRRCIIPTSGFYEWKRGKDGKQPYYFYLPEKEVFGFAGLYENWIDKSTGEELSTCTIITTEANAVLKPVHDRMPVILNSDVYGEWLDEKLKDTKQLEKLLTPYSSKEMNSYTVSKAVNIPDIDSEELIRNLNSL